MARSKNDPYKRKCAQALNHAAALILDVNDVYNAFDTQATQQQELSKDPENVGATENALRYSRMTEELKVIMMGVHACREHLLLFVNEAWGLDEESIRVYLG